MVKREFAMNPDTDVDAPRSKRHKGSEIERAATDEVDTHEPDASSERDNDNGASAADAALLMSPEEVREEGLKVLQVLRDAVNKEGRQIAYDFLRLPSKRQYPDYYEIIKQPLALEDIKTQLENHEYASLEAMRTDIETCFKNARRYNQRESIIWRDAKTLQKMANKEIDKVFKKGGDGNDGSDKEDGKKKEKGVNIHRLMKNRLQKLVAKTDDSGRQLSLAFMDLPSKKKWPLYYKLIKRPICIDDVFKRIKRKEYATVPDFMSDVDLIFTNAVQFNEEHSLIWEDAKTLQAYFRQIMTALPAKYNMNGADADLSASPEVSHNKIRLKLPGHQNTTHGATQNGEASAGTVRLRVPVLGGSAAGTSSSVPIGDDTHTSATLAKTKATSPEVSLPSAASIPHSSRTSAAISSNNQAVTADSLSTPALAMPTPAKVATPALVKPTTPAQLVSQQQQSTPYTPFHQYTTPNHIPPQNFYAPVPAPSQTPAHKSATPAPSVPTPAVLTGRTDAPSPVPPASAAGLYSVRLESCLSGMIQARRRIAILDKRAGVRNFAVQVPRTESKLIVRNIKFASRHGEEEEESSSEEETKVIHTPVKKRGRGRPRKIVPIDQEVRPPAALPEPSPPTATVTQNTKAEKLEWSVPASSEVLVRLDGQEVTPSSKDSAKEPPVPVNGNGAAATDAGTNNDDIAVLEDEWSVDVPVGQHMLEVGRKGKGNPPWRVYLSVS